MWSLPDEALGDGWVAGQLSECFESLDFLLGLKAELLLQHYGHTDVPVKSVMVPEKLFDTEVAADDFQGLLIPLGCTVCMADECGTENDVA